MFRDWLSDNYHIIQRLGVASVLLFFLSLFILKYIIIKLPHDYFLNNLTNLQNSTKARKNLFLRMFKNFSGLLLIISGIILLFMPGQGLLTIALGVCMIDFPWVQGVKRRFICSIPVRKTLNWVRFKKGLSEFKFPSKTD